MSVTVAAVSFFMMKREMKKGNGNGWSEISSEYAASEITRPVLAKALAILVTVTFAAIITAMIVLKIQGGDATALVAGAALIWMANMGLVLPGVGTAIALSTGSFLLNLWKSYIESHPAGALNMNMEGLVNSIKEFEARM